VLREASWSRASEPSSSCWQEDGTERKKESSVLGQYRGSNHRRRADPPRLEEGSLIPSDVPDGLTNINGSEIAAQFENSEDYRHLCCMSEEFDPSDYSFVVKRRGSPAKPWRWEIYRAGRSGLVECSPSFFEGMAEAAKEGKKALARFLAKQAA
jgi:hypothetical protein